MSNTCVIYTRISDSGQSKGDSLKNQELMCREEAEKRALTVLSVFTEDGKSGTTLKNRPEVIKMLNFIVDNKVSNLLITESDRLNRDHTDYGVIKKFLKEHECKLVAIHQSFTEKDDPISNFLDNIIASTNELYSQQYGLKTQMHMLKKIEAGWWAGPAPLGYRNINIGTVEKPNNIIEIDDRKAPLVEEAFKLFASGIYTCTKLNEIMFQKGLKSKNNIKLPNSSFIGLLRNQFYIGKMLYKGNIYEGKHKPLIDETTFAVCQERLVVLNKGADRARKHDDLFFLRKFLKCGICNGRYTAEIHQKKNLSYYHCSLKKVQHSNIGQNIESSELEKQIASELKKIKITDELIDKIITRAKEILRENHGNINNQKKTYQNKINALERKRDNIEEDRAERITDADTYHRLIGNVTNELKLIEKQIAELSEKRDENVDLFNQLMIMTDDLQKTYSKALPALKEQIIGLFFRQFTIKNKKITNTNYTQALQVLIDNKEVIINNEWLPRLDSNQ